MMDLAALQDQMPVVYYLSMGVLGLIIGSFLTVVIARCPTPAEPCAADLATRFPLLWPRSHCPHCKTQLSWRDLIPVLSACLSKGRCRYCGQSVTWRYMAIELSTLAVTLVVVSIDAEGAWPWLLFFWWLLALVWIDAETQLLPDALTLTLLWLGLLASALGWLPISPVASILGAVLGYVSLWCVLQAYWLIRRQEGMGYGDLKLLAALGAWFGALALPWIVLLGALSGIVGVLLRGWQKRHEPLAFGPALALGAVAYWLLTLGLTKPLETIWALLLA